MADVELGPWEPLAVELVAEAFEAAPFRWWFSGGQALELHLGRSWRDHDDIDVGVLRTELAAVYALLWRWDVHVAAAGHLTPWRGEALTTDRHENNLWCRLTATGPWVLDVTIGEGARHTWIYRRDPTIQLDWDRAVLHTVDGLPYLAPELQLLYKSKEPRPKDDVDASHVIPALDVRRREWLVHLLAADHPWQRLLA